MNKTTANFNLERMQHHDAASQNELRFLEAVERIADSLGVIANEHLPSGYYGGNEAFPPRFCMVEVEENPFEDEPVLMVRMSPTDTPVLFSSGDLPSDFLCENMILAVEENTGLLVAFNKNEAIMEQPPLIFGTAYLFQRLDDGTFTSVTPDDFFFLCDRYEYYWEAVVDMETQEEIPALRLDLIDEHPAEMEDMSHELY